jgi:hypothetical protein
LNLGPHISLEPHPQAIFAFGIFQAGSHIFAQQLASDCHLPACASHIGGGMKGKHHHSYYSSF